MALDELKKAYIALSNEQKHELSAWIADREMEAELNRRMAEAEADPSILEDGEEVFRRLRAKQKEHREKIQSQSPEQDEER